MNANMIALRGAIGITHDRFELTDDEYESLYAFDPHSDFLESCRNIGAKFPGKSELQRIASRYEQSEWSADDRERIAALVDAGVPTAEAIACVDDLAISESSQKAAGKRRAKLDGMTREELQATWNAMTPRQQRAWPNFLLRRGGARAGAGRPAGDGALDVIRKNVTLDKSSIDKLRALGDGDLSLGIRRSAGKL